MSSSVQNTRPTGDAAYRDGTGTFHPQEQLVERGSEITGMRTIKVDVCVIGSGAGGAPVAKELAEGGMSVAVLEEGQWWSTDEYTARPIEMTAKLYRDAGQTVTLGRPPVVMPVGKGIGGTTMINGGTCFRTPSSVLELWGRELGLDELSTPQVLDPFFRRVERELNVCKVPAEAAGRKSLLIKEAADRLGYSGDFVYRNVRGCVGSGICHWGCPTGAKQHVGITYIPRAWAAGAVTYTDVCAERIETVGSRARTVIARTAAGGELRVECETLVLSCGAFHTPLLLQRNGLAGESGWLGRNLSIHPAPVVRAVFDEQIDCFDGVPQAYHIDHFAQEGILFEESPALPHIAAWATPRGQHEHREVMLKYRQSSQFAVVIADSSRGSVRALPRGRTAVRYQMNGDDLVRVRRGLELLTDLYWQAGAREVLVPLEGVPTLRDGDSAPLTGAKLSAADLGLTAWHPLGTARAGVDPSRSVVDQNLRIHGLENVYIADASVVPSPLLVNPQITIMALATRLAFHLLGRESPEEEPHPEHMAAPNVGGIYIV